MTTINANGSVEKKRCPGSFRDPDGYMFEEDGVLRRAVTAAGIADYRMLMESGLGPRLMASGRMVAHTEEGAGDAPGAELLLRPERIAFLSAPSEWSFSMLRDAALLTLELLLEGLDAGMMLKDGSAWNVQFRRGKPIFIDTLSFRRYETGEGYPGYGQFCRHFLAPLALGAYRDPRLLRLSSEYVDGVPLDLAASLLPFSCRFSPGLLAHLFWHARAAVKGAGRGTKARAISLFQLRALLDHLRHTVEKLPAPSSNTLWGEYYRGGDRHYTPLARDEKRRLTADFLSRIPGKGNCWDFGGNTGEFAEIAARNGFSAVSFDFDHAAVEAGYRKRREAGDLDVLPLVFDLFNPTPSGGWANRERPSLRERGRAQVTMMLALVHHLAIGGNIPLEMIADFAAESGEWLIAEWIPKGDSQVRLLLEHRKDIFPNYDQAGFERAFGRRFRIAQRCPLPDSERLLYLMEVLR